MARGMDSRLEGLEGKISWKGSLKPARPFRLSGATIKISFLRSAESH